MTDNSRTARDVDDYLSSTLGLHDDEVIAALRASEDGGLPSIAVSAPLGKLLNVLATSLGARRILEVGTLGGYSAIWLARALPPDGRLVTLEIDEHHAQVARQNLERAGVASVAEVVVGPASDSLASMAAEGVEPFDLVFIDADKEGYPAYLEGALRLSRPGTLIVADNVVRGGQIADPNNTDSRVKGVREYIEMLAADRRVSATVVQTVGAKGYDGLAFAVVLAAE
jgi:predicted O-methyltransferase YrrM